MVQVIVVTFEYCSGGKRAKFIDLLAVAKLPPFAMIFFPGFHALIGSGMG
jgi:hypothetical protein